MSGGRKTASLLIIFTLLLIFLMTASADASINTEEMTITPNTSPYEYGTSPEHLYVFL